MPRILKLQQIDTLRDRDTGETAILYFDRNHNDFVAKIGTEEVRDPTAQGCKTQAYAMLKAFKPYVWKTYIFVDEVDDHTFHGNSHGVHVYRAKVSFEFYRKDMAQKKDGRWIERPYLEDWLSDANREPHEQYNREMFVPGEQYLSDCRKSNKEDRESGEDIRTSGYGTEQATGGVIILPYSDETWLALKVMHQKLTTFRDQLDKLIKAKDFEKRLFAAAKNLKLLPEKS